MFNYYGCKVNNIFAKGGFKSTICVFFFCFLENETICDVITMVFSDKRNNFAAKIFNLQRS